VSAYSIKWGQKLALVAAVVAVASCGVSRDGPTMNEIFAGSVLRSGDAHIIAVNRAVAQVANRPTTLGFSHNLQAGAILNTDTIRAGDIVSLNIYENVPEALLAPSTARNGTIADLQVDSQGFIFVPYAGRVRAAGRSPEALRAELTTLLDEQTPEPQVIVSREAGDGVSVSVAGGVGAQGVYPITRATQRLSGMIAQAGGIDVPLETAQVFVTRGNRQDSAWLQDIYSHPQLGYRIARGRPYFGETGPARILGSGGYGRVQPDDV
jgi:polysaccharide biosynthesis/export protein